MDENLIIVDNDFWYSIKTYRNYSGEYEFDKEGNIVVKIYNILKGKVVKEQTFKSKTLGWMQSDQIREYILDCLCIFDKRIDNHNLGVQKL